MQDATEYAAILAHNNLHPQAPFDSKQGQILTYTASDFNFSRN